MRKLTTLAAAIAATSISATALAEKWDMPMAYAATNFHSEMGVVFADKVRDYTKGEIDITVHPGGSLFKGGEIKRAVQTGQAPIGERFMSAHANEAPQRARPRCVQRALRGAHPAKIQPADPA